MKKIIAILFIGTFLTVSCSDKKTEQTEKPQEYPTLTLKAQKVVVSVEYPATLEGEQTVEIRSKIDGYIERVYVEEGSMVTKGQLLFKIDANSYFEEVNNKKAAVLAAEANLETAIIQIKRISALAEKKIVSNYEVIAAKNIERVRIAELSQANADLSAARSRLAFTNIVSPINGVVGSLPSKVGSLINVSASQSLTTVANTKNILAYFSLSQQQLNSFLNQYSGNKLKDKIKNMPEVSLVINGGESYPRKGNIQTLSGVLNASTGSANFKAIFPNPEGKLWSGASATIVIPTQFEDAILVPKKAVFELQGHFFVFTVDAQNVVHNTEIKIRNTSTENEYIITEGVKSGSIIITEGIGNLRDGVKIVPLVSSSKK